MNTTASVTPRIPNKGKQSIIEALRHGLVVSCQPIEDGPMDDPSIVAAMAAAAIAGGASGIRIEGVENLRAVRAVVEAPIIGIVKTSNNKTPVRITVEKAHALALIEAGADIVAYDATNRPRLDARDQVLKTILDAGSIAMADCSSLEDALTARDGGAEILGTTLSGYTAETETDDPGPDFELIKEFAKLDTFVMAEGRVSTPNDARSAILAGADSVTVGTSLTRLEIMTKRFVAVLNNEPRLAGTTGFAVDLGGTKTAAVKLNSGVVTDRTHRATDGSMSPDEQLETMIQALSEIGYDGTKPLGVAVSGRVDPKGYWHSINVNTLGNFEKFPIRKKLAALIGKVSVLNDALAATLAEHHLGVGKGHSEFGYITVSTGVSGGIVLGNQVVQSEDGLAGHLGFTSISSGTDTCGSGRFGTVESVASGKAIAAAAASVGQVADARTVFEHARYGDEWAVKIFDRSAGAIAELISNLTATLGIRHFAVGGGVGLSKGYIERIRALIDEGPELFSANVQPAKLGADGPLVGALIAATNAQK